MLHKCIYFVELKYGLNFSWNWLLLGWFVLWNLGGKALRQHGKSFRLRLIITAIKSFLIVDLPHRKGCNLFDNRLIFFSLSLSLFFFIWDGIWLNTQIFTRTLSTKTNHFVLNTHYFDDRSFVLRMPSNEIQWTCLSVFRNCWVEKVN